MPQMIQEKEHVACNLCRTDDARLAFKIDRFNIVQCKRCGLFYLSPMPGTEERETYSENYWRGIGGSASRQKYIEHINTVERSFRKYLKHISPYKKSGKILDIGCGVGVFLKVAQERGYETYGLEISEFASGFAREHFGLNVFTGTLDEARFQERFFDVITMFDVFSHIPDPLSHFLEIYRILDSAGVLVFTTGNYSLLPESLYKERWGRPAEHHWKLNHQSLHILLAKSGFNLIRDKKIACLIPLSPMKLSQLGLPSKAISFLMRIPLPMLSDEVMYICRKKAE